MICTFFFFCACRDLFRVFCVWHFGIPFVGWMLDLESAPLFFLAQRFSPLFFPLWLNKTVMGKKGRRSRANARGSRRARDDTHAEWLPTELWDFILNGADSKGVPLLDPSLRVVPRLVCRRWRAVVENPMDAWTRGHLDLACQQSLSTDDNSRKRQAFLAGRVVTARSAALFVRERIALFAGPFVFLPHAAAATRLPGRNSVRDARLCKGETSAATIGLYLESVGLDGGRRKKVGCDRFHVDTLVDYMVGHRQISDAVGKRTRKIVGDVPSAMMALGLVADALVYIVTLHEANALRHRDLLRAALALVRLGRDDAHTFVHIIGDQLCMEEMRDKSGDPKENRALAALIWGQLIRTASVRCIDALVNRIDGERDANGTGNGVLCRLFGYVRYPSLSVDSLCQSCDGWLCDVLVCPNPEGVVAACRSDGAHSTVAWHAIAAALIERRYDLADRFVELTANHGAPVAIWVDQIMRALPGRVPHASAITRWGAAHGYVPDAERLESFVDDYRIFTSRFGLHRAVQYGTLLHALASTWPHEVCGARADIARGLGFLLLRGQWTSLERFVDVITPHTHRLVAQGVRGALIVRNGIGTTLWDLVATSSLASHLNVDRFVFDVKDARLDDLLGVPDPVDNDACHSASLLARLAARCDQTRDPVRGPVWRFWFGEPSPVACAPLARSFVDLYRYGLLPDGVSPDAPLCLLDEPWPATWDV